MKKDHKGPEDKAMTITRTPGKTLSMKFTGDSHNV